MSDSENELEPSDEEDDDYVPSGEEVHEEVSEPEESDGHSEDDADDDDVGAGQKKGERQSARIKKNEKKTRKSNLKRGRTRRGVVYGEDESNESESTGTPSKKTKAEPQTAEEEKAHVDDLWASFLSDVNQPKAKPTSKVLVQKGTKVEVTGGDSSSSDLVSASTPTSPPQSQSTQSSSTQSSPSKSTTSEKITITKVFDFAGEEIKVTKEVSLDSEEAKEELAKRAPTDCGDAAGTVDAATGSRAVDEKTPKAAIDKLPSTLTTPSGGVSSASSPSAGAAPATTKSGTPTLKAASLSGPSGSAAVEKILGSLGKQKAPAPSGGAKGLGGLANIMGKISGGGQKKKMSVLDKTALDWKNFKDKEGISEELATFNKGKGGYLEKQKFLQQSDIKQYEAERNMRLGGKR